MPNPWTLRQCLDERGFDWASGTIIRQEMVNFDKPVSARNISSDDPLLDRTFESLLEETGSRVVAWDSRAIYVHCTNAEEGEAWLDRVALDPRAYLDLKEAAPMFD